MAPDGEDELALQLRAISEQSGVALQPLRVGNDLPPLRPTSGAPQSPSQPQPITLRQMRAETGTGILLTRRGSSDSHFH